jgi:hypothetical protein
MPARASAVGAASSSPGGSAVTACPCGAQGVTRPVDLLSGVPHCVTCHGEWHFACEGCGACLPEWIPPGIPKWTATGRGNRIDRRYCSPACRQRAYRKRKAEA